MMPDIVLLIHGPWSGNALEHIFDEMHKLPKNMQMMIQIVLVCYTADVDAYRDKLNEIGETENIQMMAVKDLVNPGFFNVNRQIMTVKSGLETIPIGKFVIKLRNDQWISFRRLFKMLEKRDWLRDENGPQILTTNCFTRKDRLYHPSDMFLCGWQQEMYKYYDCEMMRQTHLGFHLEMIERAQKDQKSFLESFRSPEKILFMNYLKHHGWQFENTLEDSEKSLRRYIYLVNSWDIGLRWNEARNPFLKSGTIILPHFFTMIPFAGVPKEKVRCFCRHDFEGKITPKDIVFLIIAKVLFWIKFDFGSIVRSWLYDIKTFLEKHSRVKYAFQKTPLWRLAEAVAKVLKVT